MQLAIHNDFARNVPDAFAMLTDPAFVEAVARASEPISLDVVVDGRRARTRRTFAADSSLRPFTGPTITLIDETVWDESSGNTHAGRTSVAVDGLPASYEAAIRLRPRSHGSRLDYDGEVTVRVPLLGPALERRAEPILLRALSFQQAVADTWPM